jgi:hypothetical protein
MSRYFSAPKATKSFYVEDEVWTSAMIPSLTVTDHEATDTGLLDANGDSIWRAANPMGFGKDDEW